MTNKEQTKQDQTTLEILPKLKDGTDLFPQGFDEIVYENNDVDTDRGTMRDRSFLIFFNNSTIILSEEDFSALTDAMKQYVDNARAEEKLDQDLAKEHENDK